MVSNNIRAKVSGLLYVMVVVTGIFSFLYVPGKLIVWENATATFNKIVANQTLFRLGMVGYLACYTFFLFLPLTLYKLLHPVGKTCAAYMVILAIVSVPVAFVNSQHQFTVLSLISDKQYLNAFSTVQLQAQVLCELQQYDNGNLVISIFSGLWLFPFGYLVYTSGFLPKILGILLMMGCFSYLINFLGNSFVKDYSKMGVAFYIHLPASLGEVGTSLWLLIMGAGRTAQRRYIP